MEVAPVHQKGNPERKTRSNVDEYFVLAIHTLATCIGLNPYKIDKETGEVSFRWISRETLWSLIRLVVFNSPFSFLPVIFAALYAPAEWKPEERSGFATSNSTATSTVYFAVCAVEYISCYSYFVLSGAAKKEISDFNKGILWDLESNVGTVRSGQIDQKWPQKLSVFHFIILASKT